MKPYKASNRPKRSTSAVQSNITIPKCYERRHMTKSEFCVYDLCRAWSSIPSADPKYAGKHIVYFDGRRIASEYSDLSPATVYRARTSLVRNGWLIEEKGSGMRNGKRTAIHYRVLNHEEWKKTHPGECANTKAVRYAQSQDENSQGENTVTNTADCIESHSHHENSLSHYENDLSHGENTLSHHENGLSHHEYIACIEPVIKPICKAHTVAGSSAGVAGSAVPVLSKSLSTALPPETATASEAGVSGALSHGETKTKSLSHGETTPYVSILEMSKTSEYLMDGVGAHPAVRDVWDRIVSRLVGQGNSPERIKEAFNFVITRDGVKANLDKEPELFENGFAGIIKEMEKEVTTCA
jgi:hypothetical protein